MMKNLLLASLAAQLFFSTEVHAVSLTGKYTDDKVCDLSPMTNYRLSRKVFVPAGTKHVSEIYARLAISYVTKECKNSQLLILHSEVGDADDERAFRNVSNELCDPATVQRESAATTDEPFAFQIKCRLVKLQEASNRLRDAEREKPLDTMISEYAPIRRQTEQSEADRTRNQDCNEKLSVGQVLLGLGGNCGR